MPPLPRLPQDASPLRKLPNKAANGGVFPGAIFHIGPLPFAVTGPGITPEAGLSNLSGLGSQLHPPNESVPLVQANSPYLVVPIASAPDGSGSTTPVSAGGSNNTPLPSTQPAQQQQSAATSNLSLGQYLLSVISNPSQHKVAVVILVLVVWWLYKHVLKKL